MEEISQSRVSMGIHVVAAIISGWISIQVASASRTLFAVIAGLVILYITGFLAQRVTGQKGIKWWAANGMIVFLFVWFISWTLLFNLA